MTRSKLKRFDELATFPNAFDTLGVDLEEHWLRGFFGNSRPLILELGCGKGEYSLALSERYPQRNILGIDRKGDRIWKGAKQALERGIANLAFLRARIEDLGEILSEGEVEQIWMPFPDPLPKRKQEKHRLLAEKFWAIYRRILQPGGQFHIKTDDSEFLEYALERVAAEGATVETLARDLYSADSLGETLLVRTTYERRHLEAGKKIKYLSFRL